MAVNRYPNKKIIKVGKRLGATKEKVQAHENKAEQQETFDKMADQMKVNSIDQARDRDCAVPYPFVVQLPGPDCASL